MLAQDAQTIVTLGRADGASGGKEGVRVSGVGYCKTVRMKPLVDVAGTGARGKNWWPAFPGLER